MEKKATGTVISVTKQWWLKINTKPVRAHTFDGAIFPHVIKIRYTVDGNEFICRKWIHAGHDIPAEGDHVHVFYRQNKPSKARVEL